MKIARVFPRRTSYSPTDDLAFFDEPPLYPVDCDSVHVSVAFSYDMPRGEKLARAWERIAPVTLGGPGAGTRGEAFEPGLYLRWGITITSRGCPNRCWFCGVWRRDGQDIRLLPIRDGWLIQDDNILACPREHFDAVCAMLARQPQRPDFRGGLEAARLRDWHIEQFAQLHPAGLWFAYDSPDEYEPVRSALMRLKAAYPWTRNVLRCYVLIGHPRDTMAEAETRLRQVVQLGAYPMAMLYRDEHGKVRNEWRRFQRVWARPAAIAMMTSEAALEAPGQLPFGKPSPLGETP